MMNRRQFTRSFMSFSSLLLITFIILPAIFSSASPTEVIRFGPKQYVCEKGRPQNVIDTFSADHGMGRLIVENGDESGHHRVSSAEIRLNGKKVFGHWAFHHQHKHHKDNIHLQESNTISVTVHGKPGSYITVTVIQDVTSPTAGISVSPQSIILGASATLSWTTTHADTVSIDQGIGPVQPSGSITITPTQTLTYTIIATNDAGTATASAQVQVVNPQPMVTISADPSTIQAGQSSTLTWSSTNAEQATIDQGIGTVQPSGSVTITPSETTVYTITVQGPGGTAQATASVTVLNPPTCQIHADPSTIKKGASATLTWTSANAESASIDQGIGPVPVSGTLTITPQETLIYTITVQGPGGTATSTAQVQVTNPQPTVTISANPETILFGGSSTLSWTSTDADTASIDQGIGSVPIAGSVIVAPQHPIIYTIIVTGPGGTASAAATVIVKADVEPQPEGAFGEQYEDLIPPDSSVGQYDAKRFSVVTGLVHEQSGAPLASVAVIILHHPEYGTAFTDAEGRYSLPVEGGGVMTVTCEQENLITAHRKVNVPWNDIAVVETMVMIPYDQKATTVTFDGNPNTVVTHQSTEVTDEWGTRSCTTVFTGDNRAFLVDEDGNPLEELVTITTRATEFITPESMPAKLPPNSAYTYCVDLTVDGAERVKFQKPVITWVDNFLGFPVGMAVPVGTYDRDRGVWVPELNGKVVKLLDTNADGIVDALDATGDNQPDDLNNNGSFSDEVKGLGDPGKYPPGATFWHFAVTHYTPCDPNWPYGLPSGATGPNPNGEAEADQQKEDDCPVPNCSFAETRSRIFHEDIPIPGTDFTLHYASNRVEGYKHSITVPASGATVPASLKRIIVKVEVAGRTLEQILNPLPNQIANFEWDGLDHLGRRVSTPTTAHVSIVFVYDAVFYIPADVARAFAQAGIDPTSIPTREEMTLWKQSNNITVYPIKAKGESTIAEGWTISAHHYLSLADLSTLHKGDGTTTKNNVNIIDRVVGTGDSGPEGDGGPAIKASLNFAIDVAFDAIGNFYIADKQNHRIRKVDTHGIITTVAGTTSGFSGDGGPATEAQLSDPCAVSLDPWGNLYIGDYSNSRIRKVDTNGIITTVAGNGQFGYGGDGGPATSAKIYLGAYSGYSGITVDAEGNLYIADTYNNRIRKVDTNGIITTVAGTGTAGFSGDGGPAILAKLNDPYAVAVDAAGNLYIADYWNHRIRKVDTSGIITTVAGSGIANNCSKGVSGDGGPATAAKLSYPTKVAVDVSGNIYIIDNCSSRIRKVDTSGIITTVVGKGVDMWLYGGDGGPAIEALLRFPYSIAFDPMGNIYIPGEHIIRKVGPPAAFAGYVTSDDIAFADKKGLGYIMNSAGRHKQTLDLDTGVVLYEFGYDDSKNLVSITDRFGNQTTITRDGNGVPRSITSPDGITTTLTIDGNNHLTGIAYPDGSSYGFEYTTTGLMTAKAEPEGNRFDHAFNANGRITDATDEEGGHWQYARETYPNGDILTEILTAEGDKTSYLDHYYSTGAYTSRITDPTGAQTTYARSADGLAVNKNLSCGMKLAFKYGLDPEYKFKYITGMWETTPAGLERITQHQKTYEDTNADKVPDLIIEQVTVNTKATTLVTNTLASTRTLTTPLGRIVTAAYDPDTLLTSKLTIPGLFDTAYGYDTKGRLTFIRTDTRETAFFYNAQGFLETITDPEGQTTSYTYDQIGRMTGIQRQDSSTISFVYDTNGNMTVLTTPSSIDHGFEYNKVNLNDVYQAPISGQYQYHYDRDRRLTQIHFPSGIEINNIYNNGRITQIQTPEGDIDFTYYCGTKIQSVAMGTEAITYGNDGSLVTSEALSGTINQTLGYTYNKDFDLTGFTYAGNTTAYTYDNDGLLTKAGAYTITRNTQNGLPTAVTGNALSLSRSFNGYGEVEGEGFTVGSSALTSWTLTRDKAGRIIQKQEQVAGTTSNYAYTYDTVGRLLTVTKDGTLVEEYQYNQNGTRISEVNTLRGITGRSFTYSDEDHLLTAGSTTYQYDADGFLLTKTKGTEVTEYSYSSRGELLQVKLPNTRVIDYYHDPLGRRIAKIVNGAIVEKYLWQGLTSLLAVYDGSNNLIMRFDYADYRMPVSMTAGGATYYFTYDQIGSLRIVSDSSGAVVKKIAYDSFGNIINDTNPGFQVPFTFAGGLHDRDTDLIRFGARDYDPDTGRWTAKDPIGFAGGSTDLYKYCINNPISLTDADGKAPLWPGGAIGLLEILDALAHGGEAYVKGIQSIAQKDYNWYKQLEEDTGVPMHYYDSFDCVDWNKYGKTFEEAWQNWLKDVMEGKFKPCRQKSN